MDAYVWYIRIKLLLNLLTQYQSLNLDCDPTIPSPGPSVAPLYSLLIGCVTGAAYKFGASGLRVWAPGASFALPLRSFVLYAGTDFSLALVSVGFIVGLPVSAVIFLGLSLSHSHTLRFSDTQKHTFTCPYTHTRTHTFTCPYTHTRKHTFTCPYTHIRNIYTSYVHTIKVLFLIGGCLFPSRWYHTKRLQSSQQMWRLVSWYLQLQLRSMHGWITLGM